MAIPEELPRDGWRWRLRRGRVRTEIPSGERTRICVHQTPMPPESLANVARALRHRNFQLFFAGQLISLIGTWMQTVAQSWLVYRLTGSALLLGTVGFASQIPVFLMSPVGGIVADRYNRHRVVIATQAASMVLACVLAVLTLTHTVTIPEI